MVTVSLRSWLSRVVRQTSLAAPHGALLSLTAACACAGESTTEVLARIATHNSSLPGMLAALASSGDFKPLQVDADCSVDDFEALGDRLARTIGV